MIIQIKKRRDGYVVLMSAIIISAVLFVVILSSGMGSYNLRSNRLNFESKQRSYFLAWSCLETGRLRVAQNPESPNVGVVTVGSDECKISKIKLNTPISGQITISSQATVNEAITNLELVVWQDDLALVSWRELNSS